MKAPQEVVIKISQNIDFEDEPELLRYCVYSIYKRYLKVTKCHDFGSEK
jgi:hypothetical protein